MLKSFFVMREPETQIELEVERTMQAMHDRMEKMLQSQQIKRQRFGAPENAPSYYR